jgi:transcriptional regulator with XRE-family HTH domain
MERNIQLDWDIIVEEAINRRITQKLSQEQLALIARVSKPTIIKFERQEGNITLESAFSILRVLGLIKDNHLQFKKRQKEKIEQ